MYLKSIIPNHLKLKFRLIKRFLSDINVDFAKANNEKTSLLNSISTIQEIKQGAFYENKVHNLKIASRKVETIIINPNEIFSFWKVIGTPSEKNGFKTGRNIIKGKVSEEIGGGLCQLSSIIYFTSLKGNLEIVERYNHSVDIYRENERFTPIGSDATVVYGYKDLRIKNNYNFPIQFLLSFEENKIICKLKSEEKIEESSIDFSRNYKENHIEVVTTINSKQHCVSTYKVMELN
ncbi:VanW family protein [Flavobacterium sp.]|uniref:VanW family protein n=1 Tax=Flavobacterium sp. TaxID=239 RepID=UPI00262AFCC7|nr:VanW family protein [Flavobacterium sp.]